MKHLVLANGYVVKIFGSVLAADAYSIGLNGYEVVSTTRKNPKIGDKASKYGR